MKLKIFLNKKIPTIEGLDHISYRINPIEKWFDFYFKAKERGTKTIVDRKSWVDLWNVL